MDELQDYSSDSDFSDESFPDINPHAGYSLLNEIDWSFEPNQEKDVFFEIYENINALSQSSPITIDHVPTTATRLVMDRVLKELLHVTAVMEHKRKNVRLMAELVEKTPRYESTKKPVTWSSYLWSFLGYTTE